MAAIIENLTTNEAAIAAGVTVAKINRMIDKRIFPKKLYKTSLTGLCAKTPVCGSPSISRLRRC